MEGPLSKDNIKTIEEQPCIKESQEMKLGTNIEELKQPNSSKVDATNTGSDNTLNWYIIKCHIHNNRNYIKYMYL